MAITSAQVQQLYVAYLGRAADKAGMDYWLNELNASPAKMTLENLRSNFTNEQPEYQNAYAGLNREETVSKIYLQLFGRPADSVGLEYWTTGGGASVNADQLLVAFVNGASAADAKVIANKVLVGEVYTSTAGDNYVQADAAKIIAGVDGTAVSVTNALSLLENGGLSGVALPAGLASIKALAIAEANEKADEAVKVTSLSATNDKVVELNKEYGATLTNIDADGDKTVTYTEAKVALTNAQALRTDISGSTTDALKTASDVAAKALVDARADLVNKDPEAVAKINAFNAAVAADAKVPAVTTEQTANVTGALQGVIGAVPANGTAFSDASKAYEDAGGSAIADADALYAAIKGANATQLAAIDKAFNTGVFKETYASLKTVAVADAAKAASTKAVGDAEAALTEKALGNTYAADSKAAAEAAKLLADAQKADALVSEAQKQIDAHEAIAKATDDAEHALPAFVQDLTADIDADLLGKDKADLFFFKDGVKGTDDFKITNFNKGDALYIGEGFSLTKNVTVNTDGNYVGTNVGVKEVFFIQDATTKEVSAVIESNAVGNAAGGSANNVAVIQLAGITSLDDVSFANGVITSNHVA
ncbi:hypothetical protein ACLNBI_19475 [Pseudomonas guariconensis]|uniref:hypothetical protein n=1 Tax=Pseudomonas guariconensis TaxID=1288410 RepID=UPI0039E7B835